MPEVYIECPICARPFDSGGNVQRVYCSPYCRTKANRQREKERFQLGKMEVQALEKVKHERVINPSVERLEQKVRELVGKGKEGGVILAGALPEGWMPTAENVYLSEIEKSGEIRQWNLVYLPPYIPPVAAPQVSVMDMFKKKE